MTIAKDAVFSVSDDVVDCELGDGRALLDTRSNTYFSLNATGRFVWDRLRERKTACEIQRALLEQFDCGEDRCAADLQALIHDLVDARLIHLIAA